MQRVEHRKICGFGFASDEGAAGAVNRDAASSGCAAPAEVGHVEQRLAVGSNVRNKRLIQTRRRRGGSNPSDICAAVRTNGNGIDPVVDTAAQVSGVVECGVNDERKSCIIYAHRESDLIGFGEVEVSRNFPPLSAHLLIDQWLAHQHFTGSRCEEKVALGIQLNAARTGYFEPYLIRIRTGRNDEVIFKFMLISVIEKIYSWVNIVILYARIVGHVGLPAARLVAFEVISAPRHHVESRNSGGWVRAYHA